MTENPVTVIDSNERFFQLYPNLTSRHIINCRLRLIPGEEHLLIDLITRGVHLIPSANSQVASRSKVHQARIFREFMLPHTQVVYDVNTLLEATSELNRHGIAEIVVKRDRKNGGIGIHRFRNIEDVYNLAVFGELNFPFVIQPFIDKFTDIRLIWLGDYVEAYERINPNNFRHNLHCGGSACAYEPSEMMIELCRKVMERGSFPYGHIDLMQLPDDSLYLTEINLRGGLRGARIDAGTYRQYLDNIHTQLVEELRQTL